MTASIPIPPPAAERMEFSIDSAANTARFTYGPEQNYANATFYVFNRDQGVGVIATADSMGYVPATAAFPAVTGNRVIVTVERDQSAASTCVVIKAGSPGPESTCY